MTWQLNNTTDIVYNYVPLEVTFTIAPIGFAILIIIIVIFSRNRGGDKMT